MQDRMLICTDMIKSLPDRLIALGACRLFSWFPMSAICPCFKRTTLGHMPPWNQVKSVEDGTLSCLIATGSNLNQLHIHLLTGPNLEFVASQTSLSMATARFPLELSQVQLLTALTVITSYL